VSFGRRQLAPILVFWIPGIVLLVMGRRLWGIILLLAPVALGTLILLYYAALYVITGGEDKKPG